MENDELIDFNLKENPIQVLTEFSCESFTCDQVRFIYRIYLNYRFFRGTWNPYFRYFSEFNHGYWLMRS